MNVIVLGSAGESGAEISTVVEQLGAARVRRVSASAELLQQIVRERPDVALIEYAPLAREGHAAVRAADYTLRALNVPTIILVGAADAPRRHEIEASTDFEFFVILPCSPAELGATIELAGGPPMARGGRGAQEIPTVNAAAVGSADAAPTEEPLLEFELAPDPNAISTPGPFAAPRPHDSNPFSERVGTAPRRPTHEHAAVGFDELVDELNQLVIDESSFNNLNPATLEANFLRQTGAQVAAFDGSSDVADRTDIEAAMAAAEAAAAPIAPPPVAFSEDEHDTGEHTDLSAALGDSGPDVQEIALPALVAGDLANVSVAKLLHAIFVTRSTGRLRLTQQSLKREVIVHDGMPGALPGDATTADLNRLVGTFAWKSGQYVLAPLEPGVVGFSVMGNPLEIIYRGIRETMSLNDVAMALGGEMKCYPIVTSQLTSIAGNTALNAVRQLLVPLRGDVTLEQAIAGAGAATESFLEAVYFGLVTGIIVFRTRPSTRPVTVRFVEKRLSAFRGVRPVASDSRKSTLISTPEPAPAAAAARAAVVAPAPAAVAVAPVEPAAPVVDERLVLAELQRKLDALSVPAPYGGFSLATGCGPDRVTDRFYELVREFHPDRFAMSSANVRTLAEKVFVRIREAQNELLAAERGQTAASRARPVPSDGGFSATPSGVFQTSAPVTGTRIPVMSGGGVDQTAKRVSDVMDRLRKRQPTNPGSSQSASTASSSGAAGDTPQPARSPLINARATANATPDQLIRQAARALEQGANDKAAEYVQAAKSRGMTGPLVDAYEKYALFLLERLAAADAEKWMERCVKNAESPAQITQIETFWGHICRMRDDYENASAHYDLAIKADKDNTEAERWVRYLKDRNPRTGGKSGEGFLQKLLSTKISLSGGKATK